MAKGGILYLHKQFMLAGFWHWNLIEMELVIARIISGMSVSNVMLHTLAIAYCCASMVLGLMMAACQGDSRTIWQ